MSILETCPYFRGVRNEGFPGSMLSLHVLFETDSDVAQAGQLSVGTANRIKIHKVHMLCYTTEPYNTDSFSIGSLIHIR